MDVAPSGPDSAAIQNDSDKLMKEFMELTPSMIKPRGDRGYNRLVENDNASCVVCNGCFIAAAYLLARFGIPDKLQANQAAMTAAQLAKEVQADTDMLYRVLLWGVAAGLLEAKQTSGRQQQAVGESVAFQTTPLGRFLEEGRPAMLRNCVLLWGRPLHARSYEGEHLYEAVKRGVPGLVAAYGEGSKYFSMMVKDQVEKATFEHAMTGFTHVGTEVALSYDFNQHHKIIDVGGSRGIFMQAILRKYPNVAQGITFDLPEVVEPMKGAVPPELRSRMTYLGGSFFTALPEELKGADCITLKHILHDWNDESCIKILQQCIETLKPGGRIVVIDNVLPDVTGAQPGSLPMSPFALDMIMMAVATGKERSLMQWAALFREAGLTEPHIAASSGALSVIAAAVA